MFRDMVRKGIYDRVRGVHRYAMDSIRETTEVVHRTSIGVRQRVDRGAVSGLGVAANVAEVVNVIGGDLARDRMPLRNESAYTERMPNLMDRLREHAPRAYAVLAQRGVVRDAVAVGNPQVLTEFVVPAWHGLVEQRGRKLDESDVPVSHVATLDWRMEPANEELAQMLEQAKERQWNASTGKSWKGEGVYDWASPVNPISVIPERLIPMSNTRWWGRLTPVQRDEQQAAYANWIISQILHGEMGALVIAGQLVETMPGRDAKLMAATQAMDEARHVEVFERYLREKLGGHWPPNDNLYTVLETNLRQQEWHRKSLPMNIMVEGLAMSVFGILRTHTSDPLLKGILELVVTDEARHVKFGVNRLEEHYQENKSEADRREDEDFAYELVLLLKNRFLANEVYERYYAHLMTRKEWEQVVEQSLLMGEFRERLFRGVMPNLRKIGLLSPRIQRFYEQEGVLKYADGVAATEAG